VAGDVSGGEARFTGMDPTERREYDGEGLSEAQLAPTPWEQMQRWVDDAVARARAGEDVPEPMALSVATADADGRPDVRTVLMRFSDARGPGFVTNTESTKGLHLRANPAIAASLTWPAMFRSIRFRGTAEEVDRAEVAAYFGQRPWGSRISAWTSRQSAPVHGREELESAYARYSEQFPDRGGPGDVPVPPFWGGYRIRCDQVEFWAGRRNRLHDRLVFTRTGPGLLDDASAWQVDRRQP
jgi:pyridoxamine 5'-phosphate oxidase